MYTALNKIKLKKLGDPVHLYLLGDFHIGHVNCDHKKLNRIKEDIVKDPYAYCIITGDNCDGRKPDHKFYDPAQVDVRFPIKNFLRECYKYFEGIIIDLQPKVLGIHEGNHDKSKFAHPYTLAICETHNIPFLGYRALSALSVTGTSSKQNRTYNIFSTHGSGGGRHSGSKLNRIESEPLSTVADIYVQGHNHYLSATHGISHCLQVFQDRAKVQEKELVFVNSGSFLRSYVEGQECYAEKNSYRPQQTGCVMLELLPHENKIKSHIVL